MIGLNERGGRDGLDAPQGRRRAQFEALELSGKQQVGVGRQAIARAPVTDGRQLIVGQLAGSGRPANGINDRAGGIKQGPRMVRTNRHSATVIHAT